LVPEVRIELTTYPLPRGCATTTLLRRSQGEGRARMPARTQNGGCYSAKPSGRERVAKLEAEKRRERLAAALRENLRRRKAGRAAEPASKGARIPETGAGTGHENTGSSGLPARDPPR